MGFFKAKGTSKLALSERKYAPLNSNYDITEICGSNVLLIVSFSFLRSLRKSGAICFEKNMSAHSLIMGVFWRHYWKCVPSGLRVDDIN